MKSLKLKHIGFCLGFISVSVSCGKEGAPHINSESVLVESIQLSCDRINKRMDSCEFEKLYSDKAKDNGKGRQVPISKKPKSTDYKFEEAPASLKNEWEFGTYLTEFKGYYNILNNTSESDVENLIRFFETFTGYQNIKSANGNRIFSNSYRANSSWNRVGDEADGRVGDGGEYSKLMLKMNVQGVELEIKTGVVLKRDDEKISVYLRLEEPVKTFLTGKILDRDGLRMKWEFYPYLNGFIVYGAAAITPVKYREEIKKAFSKDFSNSLFNWFTEKP